MDPQFPVGSGPNGLVKALLVSRDGSILVGGSFTEFSGTPVPGLVRLDASGRLDPLFLAEVPGGLPARPIVALVEGDGGTIYVMAEDIFRWVYRLLPGGAVDSRYPGVGGWTAVNLLWDGSVVGTTLGAFTADLQYATPSGELKGGYPKGLVYVYQGRSFPGSLAYANLDSKGRLIISGSFSRIDGTPASPVTRFDTQGRIEEGFGLQANGTLRSMFWTLPDGRMVSSAYVTFPKASTRLSVLKEDGNFDPAFPSSPIFDSALAPDQGSTVNAVMAEPDGRLLVGGSFTSVDGKARNGLVRFLTNGLMDVGFDVGAGFQLASANAYSKDLVSAVALQASGQILVGGAFTTVQGVARPYLARLNGQRAVGPPVIQSPPASVTNYESLTVTFTVVAESSAPMAYEWQFQGRALADATNATLTLTSIRPEDAGQYLVVVRNPAGSTASSPARLVVIPASIPTIAVAVTELRVAPGTNPRLVAT
ncbi:MAG: immunoglobulin domain-containing protein, partial [Verrucomicrobiales bacterium]|nr:immunoglobulin domain-containing protein [Verrucomicrobiales bacterium]